MPSDLQDAREIMDPYWLGVDYWKTVLADHDWWYIYDVQPPPLHHLTSALHLDLIAGIHREPGQLCSNPRPSRCDRHTVQRWHARSHTTKCPQYVRRHAHGVRPLPPGALI